MSYQKRIRQVRPKMSKSFAKLADFLLDSYIEASFMTATELAHVLYLDAATVVRFSQHLGYSGYPELLREIRSHVQSDLLVRPKQAERGDSISSIVASAMEELSLGLEQTRISLNTDSMAQLVDKIDQAQRILVLAEGPAQPAAYNLVHFLEQGGFPIHIARSGVAGIARTVYTASVNDLLIAIDIAGEAPYLAPALGEARDRGIATAAIVGSPSLASARYAEIVLEARAHESLGVGIVTTEAIIYALIQSLKWSYHQRFEGAEQAIHNLSSSIQQMNG